MIEKIRHLLSLKDARYITKVLIDKQFPGLYNDIIDATSWLPAEPHNIGSLQLNQGTPIAHRLFCIINDITHDVPCRGCGTNFRRKLLKFSDTKENYLNSYCSTPCMVNERTKNKKLYFVSRHGNNAPICVNPNCNNPTNRNGSAIWGKYCSYACKSTCPTNQQRVRETNLAKYGSTNVLASDHGRILSKQTSLEKYGVENHMQRLHRRQATMEQTFDKLATMATIEPMFSKSQWTGKYAQTHYNWRCKDCNNSFSATYYNRRKLKCPHCSDGMSVIQRTVYEWILGLGCKMDIETKQIIKPLEIDIWCPDHKIGFEIHGLYYHSQEFHAGKTLHLKKLNMALDYGINLIQIFSDEILTQPEIVKSRIANILGMTSNKIFARKCKLVELDYTTGANFLDKNHIQGKDITNIRYGLMHQDQLVSCMTFTKPRKALGNSPLFDYELSRFCNVTHHIVVGGASKLLHHFINQHPNQTIGSYCDRRWSNGSLYQNLGFKFHHNSEPNYWYSKQDSKRFHRAGFQKHTLPSKFPGCDMSKTEYEIMQENGWHRTYDCGSSLYIKDC